MGRILADPEKLRAQDEELRQRQAEIFRQNEEARKLKAEIAFKRARQEQVRPFLSVKPKMLMVLMVLLSI